jgi:hypothetical protein
VTPLITARNFSSCPSDSISRWTPCPPETASGGFRSALAVSDFRLRARLDVSIPSTSPASEAFNPAFGYGAPHPSTRGTSTLLINALLSAHHENIWFVFVLTGLLLLPWSVTLAMVPSLGEVYHAASLSSLALIAVFGIGWGIGATLVGIAFRMLGISLGFAIILGLSALLGSLVPFLLQPAHPNSQL